MKSMTLWISVVLVGVAVAAFVIVMRPEPVDVSRLLREARRCQRRADYAGVTAATRKILKEQPDNSEAHFLAAEAATRAENLEEAIEHYQAIPASADEYVQACWARADLHLFRGEAREAESALRAALNEDPTLARANTKLALLLGAEGRRWESLPYLMRLVRSGSLRIESRGERPVPLELLYAATLMNPVDPELAEKFFSADPEFLVPLIARAWQLQKANQVREAEVLLRDVIRKHPEQIEAHARLGSLLIGRHAAFRKWAESLPDAADEHPGVWVARGLQAVETDQNDSAVRCFAEAVRLDPESQAANHQLGQALARNGEADRAPAFVERSKKLGELQARLDNVFADQRNVPLIMDIANRLDELGRIWEAAEWSRVALVLDRSNEQVVARARELRKAARSAQETPHRSVAGASPIQELDLASYPLPEWSDGPEVPTTRARESRVRFDDVTKPSGIDFRYFNSGDPTTPGRLMFEYTGGGVGVIDFDRDGWPDLYLTQGREWPVNEESSQYHNQLFRNLNGESFAPVSVLSHSDDRGFGQGVAVGDIDQDGFPDLYVANIGRNVLLRNNGDGTFSDVSNAMTDVRGRWTTSCAIVDLDGDRLPDLYDVNYLTGEDIFERMCPWGSDTLRACTPTEYPGEQDQAYQNDGGGGFRRTTEAWGLTVPDGKGLGVVAADLDGSGTVDLFVANDMVPNLAFINMSDEAGAPEFVENGVAMGLGVDRDGKAQGCMGVAVGDADADGRIDLFVTNFYDESNTLYTSRSDGLFADRTISAGLRAPGYKQLGFGTQFLDGELDGLPDVVVTNGHIDDFSFEGKPHRMPPHYYQNLGGRFQHVAGRDAGDFFGGEYLGRGLARLDWNRDGLEEFAVSHLDGPSALLQNNTPAPGAFLSVRLIGTASGRDAIASSVVVAPAGKPPISVQLTAGDGYHASNQRTLHFGLGEATEPVSVEVRWISGHVDRHTGVIVNTEIAVVEGMPRPFSVPR